MAGYHGLAHVQPHSHMPTPTPCVTLPDLSGSGLRIFADSLRPAQRDALQQARAHARQQVPRHCTAFRCGSRVLGHLLPDHAVQLAQVLENASLRTDGLIWEAQDVSAAERSAQLQTALDNLRSQGLVRGWRNEDFCYWPDPESQPDPAQPAFLRMERAGFRYLGMMSHAVHINSFTPHGRMWCGKRSARKATDPGLWDNMTAGGLGAGESLEGCAVRELWEEAGLRATGMLALRPAGKVRISCITPTGWHDEMLHVYNLQVTENFVPENQDGEVQEFACLTATEVLDGIAGGRWTADAVLAVAQGLVHRDFL